jgi:hypothetical protein
MDEPTSAAPTSETPATPPAMVPLGQAPDLESYRKARDAGLREVPNPAAPQAEPVDDVAPDPEVQANPELQDAIDELEQPTDNETPAEKAARTRRHKEAARKGFATRMANKATRAEQRAADLERQLADARRQTPAGSADSTAAPATPPARPVETDPADPEPTLDTYAAQHPDDPDPYAGYVRALAKWDRRQEAKAADAKATERQTHAARERAVQSFAEQSATARAAHADYDAALDRFSAQIAGNPREAVLAHVAAQPGGAELVYHLGTHPEDLRAVLSTRSPDALLLALGEMKANVTAAAPPKAPAAPPVTPAPAPHTPVGASSTASTRFDLTKEEGSIEDYRRHRESLVGARS